MLILQGLTFKQTCKACPEQYIVFLGEEEVGRVRLKWGNLSAHSMRMNVYRKEMCDGSGSSFVSEESRAMHLAEIAGEINKVLPVSNLKES